MRSIIDHTSGVKIIWNNENLGFGDAINKGLDYAIENEYSSLVYCNNDTSWHQGDVLDLIKRFNQSESILMYPLLLERGRYCLGGSGMATHLNTRVYMDDPNQAVDYAPGTLFIIDSSIVDRIGYLDSRYFFGGEMAHLCAKIKLASMIFAFAQDIVITHEQDIGFSAQKTYYNWRNRYIFIRSFREYNLYHSMRWSIQLLLQVVSAFIRMDNIRFKTASMALYHGLTGQTGRYDLYRKTKE